MNISSVRKNRWFAFSDPRLSLEGALVGFSLLVWIAVIAAGFLLLLRYKCREGAALAPPKQWPSKIALIEPTPRKSTLVLFAHPHCPCTRATFRTLDRVISKAPEMVDVHIVFVAAVEDATSGERATLAQNAADLTFAQVHYDDGSLAQQFNARTSGQIVYYDAAGQLQFQGGITSLRGHEGDSIGGDSLTALLAGRTNGQGSAAVFGCPLFSESMATGRCDGGANLSCRN